MLGELDCKTHGNPLSRWEACAQGEKPADPRVFRHCIQLVQIKKAIKTLILVIAQRQLKLLSFDKLMEMNLAVSHVPKAESELSCSL